MNDLPAMKPPSVDALVGQIADEFTQRLNRGEQPDIEEYTGRYPEIAGVLRDVLAALLFVRVASPNLAADPTESQAQAALTGCLGDFRIHREIGRGGMGVVYEAEQISLGRKVALKVLPFAATLDSKQLQRFKNEAQAAAYLHHQNIVPVYAVGSERSVYYYAMQFVEGQTLAAMIQDLRQEAGFQERDSTIDRGAKIEERASREDPSLCISPQRRGEIQRAVKENTGTIEEAAGAETPPAHPRSAILNPRSFTLNFRSTLNSRSSFFFIVARLGVQAAEALEHAHQTGVIHRDIKPANLLVDGRGHLWITDFGLARLQGDVALTATGDLLGTLRYMSPEQVLGQRVLIDHRSDTYSLGATLYELLTLQPAFAGSDRHELLGRIEKEEPVPPRRLNKRIPAELETIVLKAMAKNPAERFASAQDLADDLQRFLDDKPIRARRPTWRQKMSRWARRHRPVVIAGAVSAAAVLIMGIGLLALSNERIKEEQKNTANEWDRRTEQLGQSLLLQAQALRYSRRANQRFAGLEALGQAAEIAPSLEGGDRVLLDLRNEAIACLALADLRPKRSLPAAPDDAYHLAFDEKFERYAWTDAQGSITIARVADGETVAHLPGPEARPRGIGVDFSADGRLLGAMYNFSGRPTEVHVWHVRQEKRLRILLPKEDAGGFSFSKDGRRLAVNRGDGSIGLYDTESGREEKTIGVDLPPVVSLAFHPGGEQLAVSARSGGIALVLDVATGTQLARFSHPAGTDDICWADGGRLLAVGCDDQRIYVWEAAKNQLQAVLDGHRGLGIGLRVAAEGNYLASRAWDWTTRLWDPVQGRQLVSAVGHLVALDRKGRQMAMWRQERLEIWEVVDGRACRVLHHGRVGSHTPRPKNWGPHYVDFSPDGRMLVSASTDGVRLWDPTSGAELAYLPVGFCETAVFSPGQNPRLLTCSNQLWSWPIRLPERGLGTRDQGLDKKGEPPIPNPQSLIPNSTLPIRTDQTSPQSALEIGPPRSLPFWGGQPFGRPGAAWSREGRWLAVVDRPRDRAILVDPEQSDQPIFLGPHPRIYAVALSPDRRWVATAGLNDTPIIVWEATTGKRVWDLPSWQGGAAMAFSPDGQWFVTSASTEKAIRYWRVGSWEPGPIIPTTEPAPNAMAFSRDGTVLAMADFRTGIKLILSATGKELATLEAPEDNGSNGLSFSPDGSLLASATSNHTVHLWDLRAIRSELKPLGLDWDLPPFAPPPEGGLEPVRVRVVPGE